MNALLASIVLLLGCVGWLFYTPRLFRSPLLLRASTIVFFSLAISQCAPLADPARGAAWIALVGCYALPPLPRPLYPLAGRTIALAVIAEAFLLSPARAGFGNPNATASVLLLLPCGVLLWPALIATGSRGALLAALIATTWRHARPALLLLPLAVLIACAARPATVAVRLTEWREALDWWAERPLVGWGPGAYPALYHDPGRIHADSAPLTILVEQGAIGLLAWSILALAALQRRPRLLAFILHQTVDYTLWWPAVMLALAL